MRRALLPPVVALAAVLAAVPAAADPPKAGTPRVDVVFAIDTTGSMGGLLEGMKTRMFSIWAQILAGQPTPYVRVGLVAYKDRGDEYVTKVTDLNEYPDAVQDALSGLSAAGGGDFPESVNQALDDAVNKISWNEDKQTLRMVFLIGDAPPHMDYPDDVKYPVTCKKAMAKGIKINAILCGSNAQAGAAFADIAKKAYGSFFTVPQDGGAAVRTPEDRRLAEIFREVVKGMVPYGLKADQDRLTKRWAELGRLTDPAAADRALLEARMDRMIGEPDLVDLVRRGKGSVGAVPDDQLPPELKALPADQREKVVADAAAARAKLYKEALKLGEKQTAALKNPKNKNGFDGHVLQVLRTQGNRVGLRY
jgi:hypothetical protein